MKVPSLQVLCVIAFASLRRFREDWDEWSNDRNNMIELKKYIDPFLKCYIVTCFRRSGDNYMPYNRLETRICGTDVDVLDEIARNKQYYTDIQYLQDTAHFTYLK
jgi:hypothetical protein